MFWRKKELPTGPTSIPSFVGVAVVTEMQKQPHNSDHWVKMRAVMRPRNGGTGTTYDIRVYDEWETEQKILKITDYSSFDDHPDLVQYEGWFDRSTKKVQLKTVRTV